MSAEHGRDTGFDKYVENWSLKSGVLRPGENERERGQYREWTRTRRGADGYGMDDGHGR